MKRSQRLANIIRIATYQEQEKARKLAQARALESQYQSQLTLLDQYLQDYLNQLGQIQTQGQITNVQALQNFQSFIHQVKQGISRQQQLVQDMQQTVAHYQAIWYRAHTRLKTFHHLLEKYQTAERLAEESKTQRMIDDYVSVNFTKK